MDSTLRRTALWATSLQALFALTWALYVAFLPGLLADAGIDARYAIAFVAFDQAVFALADWAAGVYADRLARVLGRIGPTLTIASLLSSAALVAVPWVAKVGDPALLIAVTAVWTATSSALRAPVFTLLGRVGGAVRPAGAVSVALVGVGVASALAPVVTRALAGIDARLALAVCAISLAVASVFAAGLEARVPGPSRSDAPTGARRAWPPLLLAALVVVGGIGVQAHTVMLGARVARAGMPWASWWAPVFWVGFALGLAAAARIGRSEATALALRAGAAGMFSGTIALVLAASAPSGAVFALAQGLAGAGWALFMAAVFRAAMHGGGNRGIGSPIGLVFAALAVAALARIGLAAAGMQSAAWIDWLPAASFLVAALALTVLAFAPRGVPEGGAV